MKQLPLSFILIVLLALAACSNDRWIYYNPKADPDAALQTAAEQAEEQDKLVLMVFGADWCPDCRRFSQALLERPLLETMEEYFVVMTVDVGQFDHNLEFARRFGNPIRGGIPAFAIVSPQSSLLYVNDIGDFAAARRSGVQFLDTWFNNIVEELNPRAVSDFFEFEE